MPYAAIYFEDASTVQPDIDTTPSLVTGWQHNGISSYCTPDAPNSRITIGTPGAYMILLTASWSGDPNTLIVFHIAINTPLSPFGIHRKLGGGDVGSGAAHGPLRLNTRDFVTVYAESDNESGAEITIRDATLSVWSLPE